jgi:hypothetical protein
VAGTRNSVTFDFDKNRQFFGCFFVDGGSFQTSWVLERRDVEGQNRQTFLVLKNEEIESITGLETMGLKRLTRPGQICHQMFIEIFRIPHIGGQLSSGLL